MSSSGLDYVKLRELINF